MKKSEEFLKKYNMHHSQTDMEELILAHVEELKKARKGESSSISVIPSYFDLENYDESIHKVIAVDAGGTNLRIALVSFEEDEEPFVASKERYGMPGRDKRISSEDFFNELGELIDVIGDASDHIGISFAYKGQITPEKDYIIYKMCKEVDIPDIDGKSLADGINSYFIKKYGKAKKISAVNDTSACLIGSVSNTDLINNGACIGMVLGTGFNICYKEHMKNVKGFENSDKSDIVITESGFFDKIKRGAFDIKIDNESIIPGDHVYEKMISGKYLPIIYNECMKKALEDGYIASDEFIEEHADGRYLNHLLSIQPQDEEAEFAIEICSEICRRSAMLAAANVIGAVLVSVTDNKTAVIVPEGSTVLKMKDFLNNFEGYLTEYLTKKHGISFQIVTAENNVLKGTAKAVLM